LLYRRILILLISTILTLLLLHHSEDLTSFDVFHGLLLLIAANIRSVLHWLGNAFLVRAHINILKLYLWGILLLLLLGISSTRRLFPENSSVLWSLLYRDEGLWRTRSIVFYFDFRYYKRSLLLSSKIQKRRLISWPNFWGLLR
jgi:hypothetical protein